MRLKLDNEREETFFIAGAAIGGFLSGLAMWAISSQLHRYKLQKIISSMNLKTELINWIIKEGINLDRWEFEKEFRERAQFVVIVHNMEEG